MGPSGTFPQALENCALEIVHQIDTFQTELSWESKLFVCSSTCTSRGHFAEYQFGKVCVFCMTVHI